MKQYTPESITELKENEIFVFGSNTDGLHGGGAAAFAHKNFGAKWGIGRGFTGQCYALPTLKVLETKKPYIKLTLEELDTEFRILFFHINANPNLTFYLTKIGLGIAGFALEEIKELFLNHYNNEQNLIYPIEFEK